MNVLNATIATICTQYTIVKREILACVVLSPEDVLKEKVTPEGHSSVFFEIANKKITLR